MSCKYCDEVMCDRGKTLCNGCAVEKAVLADGEKRIGIGVINVWVHMKNAKIYLKTTITIS